VLYDGAMARFSSIAKNTPVAGQSTITLVSADLATDTLNGALLFVARPSEAVDRHMEAVVVDTTSTTIVIADALGAVADALYSGGEKLSDFVVFAFNDSKQANSPTYQTQGTWTSPPSNTGGSTGSTTFTDIEADDNGGGFASWMIGALLVPDVNIGAPLIITGTTATTLTVAGDARGVAANGTRYIVYAAPFTDAQYGVWHTDAHKAGSRYLWAGYRYQPPQLGFRVDPPGAPTLGTYGAATGTNKLGQYYAWNRIYDINTGRWTTPDPAATPWWNLFDATENRPTRSTDPKGLGTWRIRETLDGGLTGESTGAEDRIGDGAETLGGTTKVDVDSNADDEDNEITDAIKNTGEDDVFVYFGHTWDTDGDGVQDTLEEHDSAAGVAIFGAAGLIGCGNDPVDQTNLDNAAKTAKGVIVLVGCKGCDLRPKFPSAKCVICSNSDMGVSCASSALTEMGDIMRRMAGNSQMSWADMVNQVNNKLKTLGCSEQLDAKPEEACKTAMIKKK